MAGPTLPVGASAAMGACIRARMPVRVPLDAIAGQHSTHYVRACARMGSHVAGMPADGCEVDAASTFTSGRTDGRLSEWGTMAVGLRDWGTLA